MCRRLWGRAPDNFRPGSHWSQQTSPSFPSRFMSPNIILRDNPLSSPVGGRSSLPQGRTSWPFPLGRVAGSFHNDPQPFSLAQLKASPGQRGGRGRSLCGGQLAGWLLSISSWVLLLEAAHLGVCKELDTSFICSLKGQRRKKAWSSKLHFQNRFSPLSNLVGDRPPL